MIEEHGEIEQPIRKKALTVRIISGRKQSNLNAFGAASNSILWSRSWCQYPSFGSSSGSAEVVYKNLNSY
jgi:hypothetical protein